MHFIIVLFLAIIIYMLQLYFYKRDWAKGLSVDISYSREDACVGDQVELIETITNEKALPLPVLSVKFKSSKTFVYDDMNNAAISDHYYRNDIFSVSGNQKIVRKQVFTTTQRGFFVIPTNTIFVISSISFANLIKSLSPFLAFHTLATPRIIFLPIKPYFSLKSLSVGLNTDKSMLLFIT